MTSERGVGGVDVSLVHYFARTKNVSIVIMTAHHTSKSTDITIWDRKARVVPDSPP